MIDWDVIRRKGEEGLLTAAETDALCALAPIGVAASDWYCQCCEATPGIGQPHEPTCPIAILEAASKEE